MSTLKRLGLPPNMFNYNISLELIKELNLDSLAIYNSINDENLIFIDNIKSLSNLEFYCADISDRLDLLSSLKLESLIISEDSITNNLVNSISRMDG